MWLISEKINWLPVSGQGESYIATAVFKYWKEIVLSYINDMFHTFFNRCNTMSQMLLDMRLRKTNTGQQTFLRPKIWTEISHSKNVKT